VILSVLSGMKGRIFLLRTSTAARADWKNRIVKDPLLSLGSYDNQVMWSFGGDSNRLLVLSVHISVQFSALLWKVTIQSNESKSGFV